MSDQHPVYHHALQQAEDRIAQLEWENADMAKHLEKGRRLVLELQAENQRLRAICEEVVDGWR